MVPPDQTADPGDDTTVPPNAPTEPDEPEVPDTPAETAHYLLPSDSRLITESDLQGMSREDVALARNEIYARHGRTFRNETYQAYFDSQSWYTPDPNYSDDTVNLWRRKRPMPNLSSPMNRPRAGNKHQRKRSLRGDLFSLHHRQNLL